MDIAIMAGGPKEFVPFYETLKERHKEAVWFGVDRGVFRLLKNGIVPNEAFGDFDSVSATEMEWINKKAVSLNVYPQEKNETDLEIALTEAINRSPDHIYLYGCTGGRLDHLFANVHLLFKGVENGVDVTIVDRQNQIELKAPGTYAVNCTQGSYFSCIPLSSQVEGLSMSGFKYTLDDHTLTQGTTLCVSNELVENVGRVTFKEGYLLFMETVDD
ncbi:thiamine diphosphokinase [Alteribacter aurantiacus]|uniref:thiamine diphosphokinase n=1 Tax=Alteribacter aurantiacus TaxID=254410 RepID=UPI0004220019|nr:thiamine diphosphokinase [Alteribacter aurantiacus]